MTREQKIKLAAKLRVEGKTNAQIGAALGIPEGTVGHWLSGVPYPSRDCIACGDSFDPRHGNQKVCSEACGLRNENVRKRRSEDRHRASCVDCHATLGSGSSWRGKKRCPTCWALHEAERVHPRSEQIVEWWADGLSLKEIASRLGWSRNHLAVEFDRLRAKGYDLPYRYKPGPANKNGTKFPEQQVAA